MSETVAMTTAELKRRLRVGTKLLQVWSSKNGDDGCAYQVLKVQGNYVHLKRTDADAPTRIIPVPKAHEFRATVEGFELLGPNGHPTDRFVWVAADAPS